MRPNLHKINFDWPRLKDALLCALSAGMLILSFPKFDLWVCAWIGLVPFFFALEKKSPRQGWWLGYVTGFIFFGVIFYWFIFMSASAGIPLALAAAAVISLTGYLAVYFGVFGYMCCRMAKVSWPERLVYLPCLWVALEYLRERLFTGFGWGALGHSQYTFLPVIQIADMTGVAGVSFLIVAVNLYVKETLQCLFERKKFDLTWSVVSAGVAAVLIMALVYGFFSMRLASAFQGPLVRLAVLQGNISQQEKWDPAAQGKIVEKHKALTRAVAASRKDLDLIIWPEASFPLLLAGDVAEFDEIRKLAADISIPLLVGSLMREKSKFYNSALLLDREGQVVLKHHKRHLVPFGEYIPLRAYFPFLSWFVPVADISAGQVSTIFPLGDGKPSGEKSWGKFGVLICFEDTVSYVARQLVLKGAQILVNITNDAWFLDSRAPFLHVQGAVFQAVQNRRALVRSANTGVSCFIDRWGRISSPVQDARGKKTFIPGFSVGEIGLTQQKSFYTKFGEVFTYLCFSCILVASLAGKFS